MWFLVFSIFCSVTVSVLLKIARRYRIDVSQAIATNYVMASALTIVLLRPQLGSLSQGQVPILVLLALGLLLPSIFIVMARAVEHAGIVRSDAAQRLSLIIPLLAAFLVFKEPFDGFKLAGIACGLLAILALSLSTQSQAKGHDNSPSTAANNLVAQAKSNPSATAKQAFRPASKYLGLWLLIGVWLGYGLIDVLFKQLAQSGLAFTSSLIISFVLAGSLMFAYLFVRRVRWHGPSLAAGLLLGLFNFGNILFYIRAHQSFPQSPALVFAAMNIGVIVLGTLTGVLLFKERASGIIAVGLLLALSAIVLLLPY